MPDYTDRFADPDFDLDEIEETTLCPLCDAEHPVSVTRQGILGALDHHRCPNCGHWYHTDHEDDA